MDCKKTNGFSESVGSVTVLSKPCRKVPRAIRGKFTFGEIFCYNIIVSDGNIQASKTAAMGSRRSFKAVVILVILPSPSLYLPCVDEYCGLTYP